MPKVNGVNIFLVKDIDAFCDRPVHLVMETNSLFFAQGTPVTKHLLLVTTTVMKLFQRRELAAAVLDENTDWESLPEVTTTQLRAIHPARLGSLTPKLREKVRAAVEQESLM